MLFGFKSKLDPNLKKVIKSRLYKNVRVLIICKTLQKKIETKIKFYRGKIIRSIPSIKCVCAIVNTNTIDRLLEYPNIEYITWDSYAFLCGKNILASNGIYSQVKYKLTGRGVGIGIIDSGIYPHPDILSPQNKIKNFVDLINDCSYPYDDNGHGTFISGIICGSGYLSKGIFRGVAENSNLYCIKAFNNIGRGFVSDILFSIDKILSESETYNIKILCLPFEIIENDETVLSLFSKLFDFAIKKNIVVVVPSGHNGNSNCSMSGISILNNCLTVGGIDTTCHKLRPYENSSSSPSTKVNKPDICAACVDICSLNCNTNYISERNGRKLYPTQLIEPYTCYTGTSCSAAYIAGICALLFENNPDLTIKDIKSLFKTCSELLDMPKSIQGNGILNLDKLLP